MLYVTRYRDNVQYDKMLKMSGQIKFDSLWYSMKHTVYGLVHNNYDAVHAELLRACSISYA